MKINVADITAEAKALAYDEPTEELNELLERGPVRDFDFQAPMQVHVVYYRAGQELFFTGSLSVPVVGHCARCLDDFALDVRREFAFVLVPHSPTSDHEVELEDEDLDLSYYSGEEVDLAPLVREQLVLALPTKPLCAEHCQGLCPECGVNRNVTQCRCGAALVDPRLAVLAGLKVNH